MTVLVRRVDDTAEAIGRAVEEIVAHFGLLEALPADAVVLLKPNLCSILPPPQARGAITDRRIVQALVALLAPRFRVLVAEGSDRVTDTREAFAHYGYTDLESAGARLVDLEEETIEAPVPRPVTHSRLHIGRAAVEADCIINLPVMKTHNNTTVSLALKNLTGCVDRIDKARAHVLGLDGSFSDYYQVLRPQLNVLDAVWGMEGNGPLWGQSRFAGYLLASDDAIALDWTAARMMGFDPTRIGHLTRAAEIFGFRPEAVVIDGVMADLGFQPPPPCPPAVARRAGLLSRLRGRFAAGGNGRPRAVIQPSRCRACGLCQRACPATAIHRAGHTFEVKAGDCLGCRICVEFCPANAIAIVAGATAPAAGQPAGGEVSP